MKYLLPLQFMLIFAAAASAQHDPLPSSADITLLLRHFGDSDTSPQTSVSIKIGEELINVATVGGSLVEIPREEYKASHVPARALVACKGWFAGSGDSFYVIKSGTQYRVYQRTEDEAQKHSPRWRLVKTVRR